MPHSGQRRPASPLLPLAEAIVVGLLVAACAPAASPAPVTTPSPSSPPQVTTPPPTSPQPVVTSAIGQLTAGYQHTCALLGGGVKCWGANEAGQLGNGSTTDSSVPVDVAGLASGVTAVAAGGSHTCAITSGGGVKCWGDAVGSGTKADSSVPVDVTGLTSRVSAIAAGHQYTCALTGTGGVKCWGLGDHGQLGTAPTPYSPDPVDVAGLASGVTAISAGSSHACALTSRGGVRCWGSTTGSADLVDVASLPSGVSAIAVGNYHTCALTSGGGVRCWGFSTGSAVLVDVAGLTSGVSAIAAGSAHACVLTSGGAVKCWGDNWYGQLGDGRPCTSRSSSSAPVDVNFATPSPSSAPIATLIGRIDHATGATDVVLRYDNGPDLGVSELTGEFFMPGPEFTLYGDGTVIFRNERAEPPAAEGPIVRAGPFMIAVLDEDEIQSLLRFAIEEGGLGAACELYETRDIDAFGSSVFSIRAGDLIKRVTIVASEAPFEELATHLRNFGEGSGIPTQVWASDRYWGSLFDARSAIEIGLLPDPRDAGSVPWPWPDIAPTDFVGRDEGGWIGDPRRVMSAEEASVLGLSDHGGVVRRVYLEGPDGETLYSLSLWPMLPDEAAP